MMKTFVVIACCFACVSCARKPDVALLDNGYSLQRECISESTTRWTLRRDTPQQSGVVAQAIVSGDEVIALLPTPVHYASCIPTAHAGSDFFVVPNACDPSLVFRLHRNGSFSIRDKMMDYAHFARTVERLGKFSTDLSFVLQIEIPCGFVDLTNAISRCTTIAGGGFGVTYRGSSRGLDIEELEEPVDRDRPPEIQVVSTNETAEPEN